MTIKSELRAIKKEVEIIKESQDRIKCYANELNKLNPLIVGQELIVNGWSHHGKTIVVDKVFVSDSRGRDASETGGEVVSFTAIGKVKKRNGDLGVYSGVYRVKVEDLI